MKSLNLTSADLHEINSVAENGPKHPIRVAIVEDDENDLFLIGQALKKSGAFVCVGQYRSGSEALAEIPKVRPEAVLMDIRMAGIDGIECARRLKNLLPKLVVIFVTGLQDGSMLREAVQAGGDDYLLKPLASQQCMVTICFTVERRHTNNAQTHTGSARGVLLLTERESAVMQGLASGLLYKEIAEKLHTSEAMVHKLQHRIYRKMHVGNRSEAIGAYSRPTSKGQYLLGFVTLGYDE